MSVQRWVQVLNLILFVVLLWAVSWPWLPTDLFLQLDPSASAVAGIASRSWVTGLGWTLLILALTIVLGRFFCGYMCPLGTTVDLADSLIRKRRAPAPAEAAPRNLKYGVLSFLLAAAVLGVSFAVWASPIPLAERLYGLVIVPVFRLATDLGLAALRPLADALNLPALAYAEVATPRYGHPWFTAGFGIVIFALALKAPRYWCRALCPAGAMFGLCARRPVLGRHVNPDCIDCGRCQEACPMGAIAEEPRETDTAECIVCRTCARVCPVDAVAFSGGQFPVRPFSPKRRIFIKGGLAGAGAAAVTLIGAEHLLGAEGPGQIVPPTLIRPPGSLPEKKFVSLCIRCGACMAVCPTNTLQPLAFATGASGFFSPVITPGIGPCDPNCTRCGDVCPTDAIRRLPSGERIWAKVGTANVIRQKCLAWEFDRKCLVCDEVCPYGAVSLKKIKEIPVPVPFVDERRCSGCGFCEHHCPVKAQKAIVVEPMDALRIASGSYREKGRAAGLALELKPKDLSYPQPDGPGDSPFGDLPPGFSD